ncbi:MAG: alpha/beta fold hydrolase [Acidimicrobiia bacterium]|nr:alpha/beta fold hydrolase [Acidimicrobiia bacterium]
MRFSVRQSAALALCLALFASACTSDSQQADAPSTTTTTTQVSTTTEDESLSDSATTSTAAPALRSTIEWSECGALECGVVDVPVDYSDPDGDTISIAVNILRASDTDRSRGALLVNPGGPGASGTSFAEAFAFGAFPEELTDNFDIVGFDPRGVGESGPGFACGESGDQLALLAEVNDLIDQPDEIAAVEAAVQLCSESMGDAAGRLGTDFVARDMDEIRKALGERQISFLGFSYGSVIGVWYATLFPENVRAMVIDGADNPVDELDTPEQRLASAREQLSPIADLLDDAIGSCGDPSCPIFNDGDPEGYYFRAAKKLDLVNEAMANNPDAGFLGLITPLYSQSTWPELWEALADLEERDDPTRFVDLAEFQLGDDAGAANFTAHVNCLDSWSLQPSIDREVRQQSDAEFFELEDQLNDEYPLLAAVESEGTPTCAFYDLINPEPLGVPFDGAGVPIVVIGNTSDPFTSFGESQELADEILASGILVEVDHPDHTVYPDNECVNALVHDVLLDLQFPADGATCARANDETREILRETCLAVVPDQNPDLTDAEAELACERFVEASFTRLGTRVVEDGLFTDDEDAGAALLDVLIETIADIDDAEG